MKLLKDYYRFFYPDRVPELKASLKRNDNHPRALTRKQFELYWSEKTSSLPQQRRPETKTAAQHFSDNVIVTQHHPDNVTANHHPENVIVTQHHPDTQTTTHHLDTHTVHHHPDNVIANHHPDNVIANHHPDNIIANHHPDNVIANHHPDNVIGNHHPDNTTMRLHPDTHTVHHHPDASMRLHQPLVVRQVEVECMSNAQPQNLAVSKQQRANLDSEAEDLYTAARGVFHRSDQVGINCSADGSSTNSDSHFVNGNSFARDPRTFDKMYGNTNHNSTMTIDNQSDFGHSYPFNLVGVGGGLGGGGQSGGGGRAGEEPMDLSGGDGICSAREQVRIFEGLSLDYPSEPDSDPEVLDLSVKPPQTVTWREQIPQETLINLKSNTIRKLYSNNGVVTGRDDRDRVASQERERELIADPVSPNTGSPRNSSSILYRILNEKRKVGRQRSGFLHRNQAVPQSLQQRHYQLVPAPHNGVSHERYPLVPALHNGVSNERVPLVPAPHNGVSHGRVPRVPAPYNGVSHGRVPRVPAPYNGVSQGLVPAPHNGISPGRVPLVPAPQNGVSPSEVSLLPDRERQGLCREMAQKNSLCERSGQMPANNTRTAGEVHSIANFYLKGNMSSKPADPYSTEPLGPLRQMETMTGSVFDPGPPAPVRYQCPQRGIRYRKNLKNKPPSLRESIPSEIGTQGSPQKTRRTPSTDSGYVSPAPTPGGAEGHSPGGSEGHSQPLLTDNNSRDGSASNSPLNFTSATPEELPFSSTVQSVDEAIDLKNEPESVVNSGRRLEEHLPPDLMAVLQAEVLRKSLKLSEIDTGSPQDQEADPGSTLSSIYSMIEQEFDLY